MPHSKQTRKKIAKRLSNINRRLKHLKTLYQKLHPTAQIIHHPMISLGQLRAEFTPYHKNIKTNLLNEVHTFQRISSDPNRPLFIYGKDGGLLAYRTSLNDPNMLAILTSSLDELPHRTNHKFRGIDRGKYSTRHYCVWSPYSKKPFISRELNEDDEAGMKFLKDNKRL
jgi:hypothetical protein